MDAVVNLAQSRVAVGCCDNTQMLFRVQLWNTAGLNPIWSSQSLKTRYPIQHPAPTFSNDGKYLAVYFTSTGVDVLEV